MNLIALLRGFTIRTRMIGAIAMVMVLLGGVGGAGLLGLMRVNTVGQDFVEGTHADSVSLAELRTHLGNVRRFEKDMVINYEKPEKIGGYRANWSKSIEDARAMAKAIGGAGSADEGTVLAASIDKNLGVYTDKASPVIKQIEAGGYDSATVADKLLSNAKESIHEVEASVAKLQQHLAEEEKADADNRAAATQQAFLMFGAVVVLAIVLVVPLTLANMVSICRPMDEAKGFAERIATGDLTAQVKTAGKDEPADLLRALDAMQQSLKKIVGEVRDASQNIQHASAEVAMGNVDLSQRTEEAASSLQQTASSMEQLTGTVRQSAESASTANQLASSAAQVAQRGGEVVAKVVSTMEEINTSSKKIADIIGTIDGIAFQTNILALNAAVEAARAGEQGRGFAVVAGEVRSLAQRSAEAAKEIKSLIGTSVDKVETGSKLVSDAGATMNEIVASVQRVTDIIGEITAAAGEQSQGIGQVNTAVTQLDQMTQQNAALVEESAAAAESLKEQSVKLAGVVSTFRLAEGHAAPAAPVAAPAARPEARPVAVATIARAAASSSAKPAAPAKPAPAPLPTLGESAVVVAAAKAPALPAPAAKPAPASTPAATHDDAGWETF